MINEISATRIRINGVEIDPKTGDLSSVEAATGGKRRFIVLTDAVGNAIGPLEYDVANSPAEVRAEISEIMSDNPKIQGIRKSPENLTDFSSVLESL